MMILKISREAGRPGMRRSFRRLVAFLLIIAAISAYLHWKWEDFAEQTVVLEEAALSRDGREDASAKQPRHDYYAEARMERDRARSRQVEVLEDVIADPKTGDEVRGDAQKRLLQLSERIRREIEAENLIKGKGYDDALVFINDGGVVVIVKARRLERADVARIVDLAAAAAGLPPESVRVTPYPG